MWNAPSTQSFPKWVGADVEASVQSKLRLVNPGDVYEIGRKPETLAERVRRMHGEAQVLACEEVDQLRATLQLAVAQAEAIRDCPDLFPSGVREQARCLAESLPQVMQTLQALSERRLREVSLEPAPPVWKR
jgi:hypothetical protein